MKMIKDLLRKFAEVFADTENEKEVLTKLKEANQRFEFLERSVYHLSKSINDVIEVNKDNQEILVSIATTQDEILNVMNEELQLMEAAENQDGELIFNVADENKDPGVLN